MRAQWPTWHKLRAAIERHRGNVSAAARELHLGHPANLYTRYPQLRDEARELRGYARERKLTSEQAAEARRRIECGEEQREVAREMGISEPSMCLLVTGRIYRDAGGPIKPVDTSRARVTEREKMTVRRLFESGLSRREVAELAGLHYHTICTILRLTGDRIAPDKNSRP